MRLFYYFGKEDINPNCNEFFNIISKLNWLLLLTAYWIEFAHFTSLISGLFLKKELASDRWKIFSIKNSELSGQEKSELSGQEKRQVERVKYDSDSDSVYSTSDSY